MAMVMAMAMAMAMVMAMAMAMAGKSHLIPLLAGEGNYERCIFRNLRIHLGHSAHLCPLGGIHPDDDRPEMG
jgi:hypothetical protein